MNGGIDRIYYAHLGSADFGMAGSSLDRDPRDWAKRLLVPAQLDYRANRPVSTVYWTDGETAVVIRRVPGHEAVGQKDSALALVGSATQLDIGQALALATECPVWMEGDWSAGRKIDRIDSARLPEPLRLWDPSDADTVSLELLWPLMHAFDRNPHGPLLVSGVERDESTVVGLIRSLVGIAAVLRGTTDLSFSTWEGQPVRGAIVPTIQFLPTWSGTAPGGWGSVVRFPYRDANANDAETYQHWAKVYLSHGPAGLRNEPQYAAQNAAPIEQPRADERATAPPTNTPPLVRGGRTNDAPGLPPSDQPTNHLRAPETSPAPPVDSVPPPTSRTGQATAPDATEPQPSVWQMFRTLPANPRDAIPVVDEMTRTPSSKQDRERIRSYLADPQSPFRQGIAKWTVAEQDRALAPLLVMVLRESDWAERDVTQSVDRLLRAIHGEPRRGRPRWGMEFTGLGPNVGLYANWLLAVALIFTLFLLSLR